MRLPGAPLGASHATAWATLLLLLVAGHLIAPATCTVCPPNAVSDERYTTNSTCFCPAGYTGDAGVGDDCVSCAADTYKNWPGPGAISNPAFRPHIQRLFCGGLM